MYSRKVKFHDAEGVATVKAEISDGGLFSISGERGGSYGQIDLSPSGENQKKLKEIWDTWHLNYLQAGCEHQRALGWENDKCGVPCPECGYEYGSKWLKKDLPENFETDLDNLLDKIEDEETERAEGLEKVEWESLPEKVQALGKYLEINPEEAQNDITDNGDCRFDYSGTDYLVCTDEEADEKWRESIDNYIEECVLQEIPENYQKYFDNDKFAEDCRQDGRGHSLNNWDGDEGEEKIDGTYYYIYRQ